jgi:putative membrane protein
VSTKSGIALLVAVLAALAVSAIHPFSYKVWLMESCPVMIGAVLILATWRRFPLTPLLCWLIAIHSIILIIGAHYTYSKAPIGFWIQDVFDMARNPWDRVGHFAQGFAPAILAREILIRTSPLRPGKWLFFLVVCVCLAFSAFYELVEWWAAIGSGDGSPEFLGTQGDVWDAQWDMLLALVGAILAQLLLSRLHDRQLARLPR